MAEQPLKLFFDGGCRPNPGPMETAVATRGQVWYRRDIGHGTNDEAEWQSLLDALDVASELGARDIVLLGDSALIVAQASGTRKPGTFTSFHAGYLAKVATFTRVRMRRIKRAQNLAGIALAKGWPR
jgi:ribonuclease HI